MTFRTLDDVELDGKTVLVRVDINVPMKDGEVTDTTRMEAVTPTIREIVSKGGKPVLLAHFGRPKGKVNADFTLAQLVQPLSETLDLPVSFAPDCIGPMAERAIYEQIPGTVLLLENVRFHAEEEANDASFAQKLAAHGTVYVNDAFSAAHRAHASTDRITRHVTSVAGRLMQAELEALSNALGEPKRPVIAVVGGAKVSTKLDLLGNLISKVDQIVIGGGMANTFLAAKGIKVGKSLCEHDLGDTAREIMQNAQAAGCELVLPLDIVVAREFAEGAASETLDVADCPADAMILDAGPASVADISARFEQAKTLVWNGPLGAFEIKPFDTATNAAAVKAAELSTQGRLLSVAGGGDTVAALNGAGVANQFTYISTAGGAFLEWLEGKTLPGVAALQA